MNQNRFDALTRTLISVPSRRHLLRGLAGAGLGLGFARLPHAAEAKKKRKRKKRKEKKPQPNAFGCFNVGQPCNGDSANCCSGICEGTPPKKGKKDTSRCVAHDTGGCRAGQIPVGCGGSENVACTTSRGKAGSCHTTTGQAGFCAVDGALCHDCTTDPECEAQFGIGAACVLCPGDCADFGGRACAAPDFSVF
jgi:hypothetical protein